MQPTTIRILEGVHDRALEPYLQLLAASFPPETLEPRQVLFEEVAENHDLRRNGVHEVEGRVVAAIRRCRLPSIRSVLITHIAVSESERGHGLGTQLLQACLDEEPALNIVVEVESKPGLIKWYERHGFRTLTENYYQPALRVDTLPVQLRLMATKPALPVETLVESIQAEVYRI